MLNKITSLPILSKISQYITFLPYVKLRLLLIRLQAIDCSAGNHILLVIEKHSTLLSTALADIFRHNGLSADPIHLLSVWN